MKKFIVIPDSYKGTLSSEHICEIMSEAILKRFPEAQVVKLPVADGGEGTVATFLQAVGGKRVEACVTGPLGVKVSAFYGLLPDGTAVIEMASAAGLPLVGEKLLVGQTTTYGVGELIAHAISQGAKNILLGLGGSATNDGGCGAAVALGATFKDKNGVSFLPTGSNLINIASIDVSSVEAKLKNIPITVMCDIDNPLYGPKGAAYVFAPQKGATIQELPMLDAGLKHLAEVIEQDLGMSVAKLPGAGAAGGMGAGAVAFLGGNLTPGIEAVLNIVKFNELLEGTDMVFTGEGCFDRQSLMGKVISGILKRTNSKNIPVIAIVGGIKELPEEAYDKGLKAIFSINQLPQNLQESAPHSKENLAQTMDNILRLLALLRENRISI